MIPAHRFTARLSRVFFFLFSHLGQFAPKEGACRRLLLLGCRRTLAVFQHGGIITATWRMRFSIPYHSLTWTRCERGLIIGDIYRRGIRAAAIIVLGQRFILAGGWRGCGGGCGRGECQTVVQGPGRPKVVGDGLGVSQRLVQILKLATGGNGYICVAIPV